MCAAKRAEALGPWRLEWDDSYVTLQAFGVTITTEISQSDPMGLTLVHVGKINAADSEIAVQIYQDGDLCKEF